MDRASKEELLQGWEAMAPHGCLDLPGRMESLERCELLTELAVERLEQKAQVLEELFRRASGDWNQTLYAMLLRTVGDLQNRENYLALAQQIPYQAILRERESILRIEALLFGGAGLLESSHKDDYTVRLREEYTYLCHKYRLEPTSLMPWQLGKIRPANHPRLRLSQLASLLRRHEYLFEGVISCRTAREVEELYRCESSQYWSSYYADFHPTDHNTKYLGRTKAHLLGINLSAPLQYFYGRHTGREELRLRAIELWESLPAEENRYTRIWAPYRPANALESQALLQLAREYCATHSCRQCPLARQRLRTLCR